MEINSRGNFFYRTSSDLSKKCRNMIYRSVMTERYHYSFVTDVERGHRFIIIDEEEI